MAIPPQVITAIAQAAGELGGKYLGNKNQQNIRKAESEALTSYLKTLDSQRDATKGYMQGSQQKGEEQFFTEANKPLEELTQQGKDIQQATTEQQQEASNQLQAQLAQQGVRGGQASTLLGRGTGQIARESLRDINQLKYGEAQGRQQARLGYTAQKGLIPYSTLNAAEWLHMPSDTEKQLMTSAINKKYS